MPRAWKFLIRGVAPVIENRAHLSALQPAMVIDVGANKGQFSALANVLWPKAAIVAFEPIPDQAAIYRRTLGHLAILHECALGDAASTLDLHIASRADSSSLLPLAERQKVLFSMDEVSTISVAVRRLDEVMREHVIAAPVLLKIDVQGFEGAVIAGLGNFAAQLRWIYVEMSFVELYEGQKLYPEVRAMLERIGFRETARNNLVKDDAGIEIQADFLYERP
jgi:FkbM family methyltransferase